MKSLNDESNLERLGLEPQGELEIPDSKVERIIDYVRNWKDAERNFNNSAKDLLSIVDSE